MQALVDDELARMCSLIEDELLAKPLELSAEHQTIDLSDWSKSLLDD